MPNRRSRTPVTAYRESCFVEFSGVREGKIEIQRRRTAPLQLPPVPHEVHLLDAAEGSTILYRFVYPELTFFNPGYGYITTVVVEAHRTATAAIPGHKALMAKEAYTFNLISVAAAPVKYLCG